MGAKSPSQLGSERFSAAKAVRARCLQLLASAWKKIDEATILHIIEWYTCNITKICFTLAGTMCESTGRSASKNRNHVTPSPITPGVCSWGFACTHKQSAIFYRRWSGSRPKWNCSLSTNLIITMSNEEPGLCHQSHHPRLWVDHSWSSPVLVS